MASILVEILVLGSPCEAAEPGQFPRYRHVDRAAIAAPVKIAPTLTLLTDEDFAPFSFKTVDNKLTGISVQIAMGMCAELKVKCLLKSMPFSTLMSALQSGEGDVIIGGPKVSTISALNAQATRPYFLGSSQFLIRTGSNLSAPDSKTLAGRRLGYVKGTGQAAFLAANYDRSSLVPFPDEVALFESLRTGGLDAALLDSLHGAFWLKGSNSRGCCVPLGSAFFDHARFSHSLAMIVRSSENNLRESLDLALDRLQEKGTTAKILATYLPSSPF